ncbi:hypothetical protein K7432_005931 [Basidiobolus ranarum]|uniref:Uncharacterized protein n=1 Tax=Basidiobolus ranarum TaxID=34480 RepID=A0ABR2W2S7_9FUNG
MTKQSPFRRPMLAAKSTGRVNRIKARANNPNRKRTLQSDQESLPLRTSARISTKKQPSGVHDELDNSLQTSHDESQHNESIVDEVLTTNTSHKPSSPHKSSPLLLARFKQASEYRTKISEHRDSLKTEIGQVRARILDQVKLIEAIYKTLKETQFYHQRTMALLSEKLSQLGIGEVPTEHVFEVLQKIASQVERCLENNKE